MKHSVSQKHLASIGDVVVSFNLLEQFYHMITWGILTDSQELGRAVTAKMSFRKLREIALELYKKKNGEDGLYSEFLILKKKVDKIEDERDRIVHDLWMGVGGELSKIQTTMKQSIRTSYDDGKFIELLDMMDTTGDDLLYIFSRMIDQGKARALPFE